MPYYMQKQDEYKRENQTKCFLSSYYVKGIMVDIRNLKYIIFLVFVFSKFYWTKTNSSHVLYHAWTLIL